MAVFPDIAPSYNYIMRPVFRTLLLGPTDGDFIQRRKKRTEPLYEFRMQWNYLSPSEEKQIIDFYLARSGSWDAFAFFDFDTRQWNDINLGTGDGSTTQFNLKAKACSNIEIKINGIINTNWSLNEGQGTDGQDRITFNTAPESNAVITASYQGRRYFPNCIFKDDEMDITLVTFAIYRTGLIITEVSA